MKFYEFYHALNECLEIQNVQVIWNKCSVKETTRDWLVHVVF